MQYFLEISNVIEDENVEVVKESIICLLFNELVTKALKVLVIELEETIVPELLRYLASLNKIGFDLEDNETS